MPSNKDTSRRMGRQPNKNEEIITDYVERRIKNNKAVRKSREKSRKKAVETLDRVTQLKKENCELEGQIKLYKDELSRLKEAFLTMAGSGNVNEMSGINFDALLKDSDDEAEDKLNLTY